MMSEGHKFPECSIWRNGECTCDMHPSTVEKIKRLEDDLLIQDSTISKLQEDNAALKKQLENQNGGFCDPYCFAGIKKDEEIEALRTALGLEKDWSKNDSGVIKSFSDAMEKRNKANAALVKRWAELGEWVKLYKGTGSGNEFYRGTIKCKMNELQNG